MESEIHLYFASFTCVCGDTGYEGTLCSVNINECTRGLHQCGNGTGLCEDREGNYTCLCNEGYTGNNLICNM